MPSSANPGRAAPRERSLTTKALRYLRERGAFAEKIGSGQRIGMSDIVACYRGRFLGLETKRLPGQVASPAQAQVLQEIMEAGGVALVLAEMRQLIALLDEIDHSLTTYYDLAKN